MPSKGMIFTGWCVRALLEERKTQTMRIIRPQPPTETYMMRDIPWSRDLYAARLVVENPGYQEFEPIGKDTWCAPHQPGDIVYVKEALRRYGTSMLQGYAIYDADQSHVWGTVQGEPVVLNWRWKCDYLSSRFMPHEAARLWNRILDVRVMRTGETTDAEAMAEGIACYEDWDPAEPVGSLARAWDELHNKPGDRFGDGPFVFRYKFEPAEKPEC